MATIGFLILGGTMRRRDFVQRLGGGLIIALGIQGTALSQQSGRVARVGVLVSSAPPHPFADALRRGLRILGYTEGLNFTLDVRYTDGRSDRANEFAAELARSNVDVIVAHFTPSVRAAMAATKTIPIVMAPAGAPLQSG